MLFMFLATLWRCYVTPVYAVSFCTAGNTLEGRIFRSVPCTGCFEVQQAQLPYARNTRVVRDGPEKVAFSGKQDAVQHWGGMRSAFLVKVS